MSPYRAGRAILVLAFASLYSTGCGGGGGSGNVAATFQNCIDGAGCGSGVAATPEQITGLSSPQSVSAPANGFGSVGGAGTVLVCDQNLVHVLNVAGGISSYTVGASGVGTAAFGDATDAVSGSSSSGQSLMVVDAGGEKVDVFSISSLQPLTYVTSFGQSGSGSGQFSAPDSIALDSSGDAYVADASNGVVEVWTYELSQVMGGSPSYVYTSSIGASVLRSPRAVAVDFRGNVFVADTTADVVYLFAPNGTLTTTIGARGTGAGQFSDPTGVAVDTAGNVYVADPVNKVVDEFKPSGSGYVYSHKVGSSASSSYQYGTPTAVASDGSTTYVLDSANKKVIAYPQGY